MGTASFEQIRAILRSLSGALRRNITDALNVAKQAKKDAADAASVAAEAKNSLDKKMNADDPVGTGSFSMNRKSGTFVGDLSFAEGRDNEASGISSHAEGEYNVASGNVAHAEGHGNTASGGYSHAEGFSCTAGGGYSHAEGENAWALGNYSHAEGRRTRARGNDQHVQGRYNVNDGQGSAAKYAHIVGNGTSEEDRSNAHTIDWDGNGWFAGTVEGTALILSSPDGSRWQITVDNTGALSAAKL